MRHSRVSCYVTCTSALSLLSVLLEDFVCFVLCLFPLRPEFICLSLSYVTHSSGIEGHSVSTASCSKNPLPVLLQLYNQLWSSRKLLIGNRELRNTAINMKGLCKAIWTQVVQFHFAIQLPHNAYFNISAHGLFQNCFLACGKLNLQKALLHIFCPSGWTDSLKTAAACVVRLSILEKLLITCRMKYSGGSFWFYCSFIHI